MPASGAGRTRGYEMIKRNLLVIGLAGLLGACGFQLRGTGDVQFALKELDVSAVSYTHLTLPTILLV